MPKISNSFIESAIHKSSHQALKVVFYLSSILEESITTNTELHYDWEPIKPSQKIEGIRFFNITSNKKFDTEPSKFKAWFYKEFKDYKGALVGTLHDGEIYLNEKGYFYDARDKKHKFTKDEIYST